jgi:hypothetical protein
VEYAVLNSLRSFFDPQVQVAIFVSCHGMLPSYPPMYYDISLTFIAESLQKCPAQVVMGTSGEALGIFWEVVTTPEYPLFALVRFNLRVYSNVMTLCYCTCLLRVSSLTYVFVPHGMLFFLSGGSGEPDWKHFAPLSSASGVTNIY